jgi:hypothetical protein
MGRYGTYVYAAARYNIKVTVKRGEVHVSVDHGLTGVGHPHLYLRRSASSAAALNARVSPKGLAWSVTDRLRNGGDENGRVLAIWQELPEKAPVPLTALARHAHGTGPLYVPDIGDAHVLDVEVGRQLTAALLDALLQAAAHTEAPVAAEWQRRLRWSQAALAHAPHRERVRYSRANLRRAHTLAFTKYVPPPAAAHCTKGAWLGRTAVLRVLGRCRQRRGLLAASGFAQLGVKLGVTELDRLYGGDLLDPLSTPPYPNPWRATVATPPRTASARGLGRGGAILASSASKTCSPSSPCRSSICAGV